MYYFDLATVSCLINACEMNLQGQNSSHALHSNFTGSLRVFIGKLIGSVLPISVLPSSVLQSSVLQSSVLLSGSSILSHDDLLLLGCGLALVILLNLANLLLLAFLLGITRAANEIKTVDLQEWGAGGGGLHQVGPVVGDRLTRLVKRLVVTAPQGPVSMRGDLDDGLAQIAAAQDTQHAVAYVSGPELGLAALGVTLQARNDALADELDELLADFVLGNTSIQVGGAEDAQLEDAQLAHGDWLLQSWDNAHEDVAWECVQLHRDIVQVLVDWQG